jgi:hypothetical protein
MIPASTRGSSSGLVGTLGRVDSIGKADLTLRTHAASAQVDSDGWMTVGQ